MRRKICREVSRNVGGLIITEQQPEVVDAETFIKEIGIAVDYIDTIDDAAAYLQ